MTKAKEIRNRNLMLDIIEYLQKNEMFDMVNIYVNGRMYSSENRKKNAMATLETKYGTYYDHGPFDVASRIEYCNPETLTMTFEGTFYDAYNGNVSGMDAYGDFERICAKYGLYPEQGYAWSLACYET